MKEPRTAPPEAGLVQQLLAERRELKVMSERLRLELGELQSRIGKPDPRISLLEQENRRLREELAFSRGERDLVEEGVNRTLDRLDSEMKKASV